MAHIMLVDDDEWFTELYVAFLRAKGHTLVTARDCFEAMGKLGKPRFDLIMLDFFMPHANALTLLHELRSYPDLATIPVLLMSGQPPAIAPDLWREYGVARVVDKTTIRPNELCGVVNEIIGLGQ